MYDLKCKDLGFGSPKATGLVSMDSVGIMPGALPMFRDTSTYWMDGNFTTYYEKRKDDFLDHVAKYNERNCYTGIDVYWLGRRKLRDFYCYFGQSCKLTIYYIQGKWYYGQTKAPSPTQLEYKPNIFDVKVKRMENEKLVLSYKFDGPSKTTVYFNEVRVQSNYYLKGFFPGSSSMLLDQKVCLFDPSGIPEGVFSIEPHPLPEY